MKIQIFHDQKTPKVDSNYTGLAVISLDSTLKNNVSYYPQVFLRERKYIERKVIRHISNDLRDFCYSDESDEE